MRLAADAPLGYFPLATEARCDSLAARSSLLTPRRLNRGVCGAALLACSTLEETAPSSREPVDEERGEGLAGRP